MFISMFRVVVVDKGTIVFQVRNIFSIGTNAIIIIFILAGCRCLIVAGGRRR